jgi:glycosyltransferase involved in cell wall biosynthesis
VILIAAHHWFDDVIGGSFRVATEFAEHLASQGMPTSYLCCGSDSQVEPMRTSQERGVRVIRYRPPMQGNRLTKLRFHIRRTSQLARELAEAETVDVVNGHSPLQYAGVIRALGKRPAVRHYTVHSPFDDELASNSRQAASLPMRAAVFGARWVERRNVVASSAVHTLSEFTLSEMRRKYGDRLNSKGVVVPGWVDCEKFQPASDRRSLRASLGGVWNTDDPVFFTVRRLETRMGLDTLIQAAVEVRKRQAKFRLIVGGSGSQRESLERLIQQLGLGDTVFLTGRIPEEQLAASYAAADCFVLPTRALECFGLIVLEAFAAGTPVIASNVAAIPELAAQQGEEWLFPPGDVEALSERLLQFLDGRLVSAHDVRKIAEKYDRAIMLERWTRLLCQ